MCPWPPLNAAVRKSATLRNVKNITRRNQHVSYKSSRPPHGNGAGTPAVYLRQLAAYRAVLGRIYPGKSIRCAILWTAAPALFEVPGDMLEPYAVDLPDPPT